MTPAPLRLGRRRPADAGLPRRGMGRARARRPGAVGEAGARRLPGRPRLDHRAAQARRLPRGLRRLRPGSGRPLRRGRRRPPARRRRHHPLARQDRGDDRRRAHLPARWPTRGEDFAAYCWSFTDGEPLRGDGVSVPGQDRALGERSRRISSGAASSSSARPSSTPGCRRWASSTTTPSTASAATRSDAVYALIASG